MVLFTNSQHKATANSVCSCLASSLVCAAGATENPRSMDEAQESAGKALATGMDLFAQAPAPAPAPVRNTQALPKHTHIPVVFSIMTGNRLFPIS